MISNAFAHGVDPRPLIDEGGLHKNMVFVSVVDGDPANRNQY
jgi:hypothetical protein